MGFATGFLRQFVRIYVGGYFGLWPMGRNL
jgi:hypothetical protein